METNQSKALKTGIFIILGIFILVTGIYFLGKKQYLFSSSIRVYAIFNNVQGLNSGNKILFSGIEIGTVNSVAILSDTSAITTLTIEESAARFIKRDSRVSIANQGIMGSKIIVVLPGSQKSASVRNNDTLQTIEQVDINEIINEVNMATKKITNISENLVQITDKINRGEGIFGKLFTDTTLTRNLDQFSENAKLISRDILSISNKIEKGEGLVGKLFVDTSITKGVNETGKNLQEITSGFSNIIQKIDEGEGVFGKLFTDTALTENLSTASKSINSASENLKAVSGNLVIITTKMKEGKGIINKLLVDSAFADSIANTIFNINKGVKEATKASEAIKNNALIKLFSGDNENQPKEKNKKEKEQEGNQK